jgi:hypothetical protein
MKIPFQITKIASTFCLFLCLFLAPIQLHAEEEETSALGTCYQSQTPEQAARLQRLKEQFSTYVNSSEPELPFSRPYKLLDGRATDTVSPADANKMWFSADDEARSNYCQNLEYIKQRISLGNIGQIKNCNTLNVTENDIADIKCTQLVCQAQPNGLNKYYASSNVKRYDTDNSCLLDQPGELCQLNLRSQITVCEACRSQINAYIQNPTAATTPKDTCEQFKNISNCSTAFSCTTDNPTPAINEEYAQTPFGTEFFDVNDPQTGFNSPDEANRNFTTNIQGGPIIGTINTVANFMVRMISVLSLVVFVIGAFLLIVADGDENRLTQGKDAMKLALIGIVIVMMSYTIVVLVQSLLY